jgi:hypothetical protein
VSRAAKTVAKSKAHRRESVAEKEEKKSQKGKEEIKAPAKTTSALTTLSPID